MKKWIFLFVFFLCSTLAYAQVIYATKYDLKSFIYSNSANIKATSDSGFVVFFDIRDTTSANAFGTVINKFDKDGKLQWSKQLYHSVYNYCDVEEYEGGFLVAGNPDKVHMVKLDKMGNLLGHYIFGLENMYNTMSMYKLNKKDIFIYGYNGNSERYFLLKTDTAGNYIWSKDYMNSYTLTRMITDNRGNIYSSGGTNRRDVYSLDSLGNMRYDLTSTNNKMVSYISNAYASDGNLYGIGTISDDTSFVYKMDGLGQVIWTSRAMPIDVFKTIAYKNGLLLSGLYSLKGKTQGSSLAKVDWNGNVEWQFLVSSDPSILSMRHVLLKNGKLVLLEMFSEKFRICYISEPGVLPCGKATQIPAINYTAIFSTTPLNKEQGSTNMSHSTAGTQVVDKTFQATALCHQADTVHKGYRLLEICKGDSILLAGKYQKTGGKYIDSLIAVNGMDSLLTNTLTVHPSYNNTVQLSICKGDSIKLLGSYRKTSATIVDHAQNRYGCDSTTTILLAVNNLPAKPAITRNCNTLQVPEQYSCQWFRNDTVITDSVKSSICLNRPGKYKVVVMNLFNCANESDVFDVPSLEFACIFEINIFPVPASDKVKVRYTLIQDSRVNIELYNAIGQHLSTIVSGEVQSKGTHEYTIPLDVTGTYFLNFTMPGYEKVLPFVISR